MGMLVVYWPLRPRSIETPPKTDSGHDKAAATPTFLTQVVCYNRRRAVLLQLQVEPCKNLGAGFCLGIWQRSGDHVGYGDFVMLQHVRTPAPTRVSWNIRCPIALVPLSFLACYSTIFRQNSMMDTPLYCFGRFVVLLMVGVGTVAGWRRTRNRLTCEKCGTKRHTYL